MKQEVAMKWITRENVKVDRVACPWLIRKFVDPGAEFLFVEESKLLEDYKLSAPGLARLAIVVRAADVKGQEQVAPEGMGLRAIAQGTTALGLSDQQRLAQGFPMYDALLHYARDLEARQEFHSNAGAQLRSALQK
jgi:hypothetical protein